MKTTAEIRVDDRKAALTAVLQSKEFTRAPALAKLLKYLCEKTFEGRVHEIKEFSIATEVYGRSENFGEKRDSVVRVEMSRLRKRLVNYYGDEGIGQALRIVIPAGTYAPEFEPTATAVAMPPDLPAAPPSPRGKYALITATAASILLVAAVAVIVLRAPRPATTPNSQARTSIDRDSGVGFAVPHPIRILAGSSTDKSVDRFGVEWAGDRYFAGGEQNRWEFGGKEMGVPVRTIRYAPDQLYFRSFRFGNFSYRIPLPEGKYDLRLYFSEVIFLPTEFGDGVENRRIFDVLMNGQPLLSSFDIAADAGGANTAIIRAFSNVSPVNGYLTLDFRPILSGAWLNAIELIPNNTGRPRPIRIFTRNANFTDHAGSLWELDRYYSGGRQISDGEIVGGTPDPELFLSQRYGNFSYRFPVPSGRYALRLLFAETFFGPHNRGKGGPGSRIFNVASGGVILLHNFEIFKEAGERRSIEKVFHGLVPNAQGQIEVAFEPVVQYAVVNALELTSER
uniref:Malectin domain-containing protein n=1 Tax=Solibacter usitatus (strain Ellin6076) TaxID=234267 RepID=Q01RD0_SOLUE